MHFMLYHIITNRRIYSDKNVSDNFLRTNPSPQQVGSIILINYLFTWKRNWLNVLTDIIKLQSSRMFVPVWEVKDPPHSSPNPVTKLVSFQQTVHSCVGFAILQTTILSLKLVTILNKLLQMPIYYANASVISCRNLIWNIASIWRCPKFLLTSQAKRL